MSPPPNRSGLLGTNQLQVLVTHDHGRVPQPARDHVGRRRVHVGALGLREVIAAEVDPRVGLDADARRALPADANDAGGSGSGKTEDGSDCDEGRDYGLPSHISLLVG